jgi:pre-mRNA-splicing factor 38A
MRLTGTALDCYKYLEPLYYDYRKIKRQSRQGGNFIIKLISYNLKQRIHACSKTGKNPYRTILEID